MYKRQRHLPGAATWGDADAVLVSRGGRDSNVTAWVMREGSAMHVLAILPDTPEATDGVQRLFARAGEHLRALR